MVSLSIHHVIAALAVILPIAATRGNVYVHRAVTSEPLLQHEFGWFRDGDGKDKITDQYQVWETKDNGELKGKHTFKIEIQINGKIETPSVSEVPCSRVAMKSPGDVFS